MKQLGFLRKVGGHGLIAAMALLACGQMGSAAMIVTNADQLPPPGDGGGWIAAPSTQTVRFVATPSDGWNFTGTFVVAHSMVVSDISGASQVTNGNDVHITFNAVLVADISEFGGTPFPTRLNLPGWMTVVLSNKAHQTLGNFPLQVTEMWFTNVMLFPMCVRQHPSQPSLGHIAIHNLANGQYQIQSELDIHSQFSISTNGGAAWNPFLNDADAPTHYALEQRYTVTAFQPRLNGGMELHYFSATGTPCHMECAEGLPDAPWQTLSSITSSAGPVIFTVPATNAAQQLFRAATP